MPQWKQYSGNWTVTQQMQARGGDEWPTPPGAPTIGTATAGDASATVTFTAPANLGIPATIIQYTVTSSPGGITATGTASPIIVTGLTNNTSYTFTVTATNATGTGLASDASNSVVPQFAGKIYAAGGNDVGQLGNGTVVYRSSPVQIGSLTTWKQAAVNITSYAIKEDGTIWAWGSNATGALGINATGTAFRSSPVQIGSLTNWSKVTAGPEFALALKTDGTLWSWGEGTDGQLGQGVKINRSSPVQVGALTNWSDVSAGFNHAIAIKTDGTLWGWGKNLNGAIGDGTAISKSSPVQIGALTTWSKISSGYNFTLAIQTNGTLWSFGDNTYGELGLGNTGSNKSSPTQVGSVTSWKNISAGVEGSSATRTTNTLWTWGRNGQGQLGHDDIVNKNSPVQVGSLTDWNAPSFGRLFMGSTKTDGTLWSWGANDLGQLGQGNRIYRSSPVQVGALTNWFEYDASRGNSGNYFIGLAD